MIVSVCVDTVACAPRWRRLGFNDCKGSGFSEKHQTAKGKVASHAQPQTPKHPAPSMPSPTHARASSLPNPFRKPNPPPRESQNPPTPRKPKPSHPFRKPNPPTPRKPFSGAYLRPPSPAKNPPSPAKPPKNQKERPPKQGRALKNKHRASPPIRQRQAPWLPQQPPGPQTGIAR